MAIDSNRSTSPCFVHSLLAGQYANSGYRGAAGEENDNSHVLSIDDYVEGNVNRPSNSLIQPENLTATQLSDVAWNVRTLSKRLNKLRLKLTVRNIVLVAKIQDKKVIQCTKEVAQWLLSIQRDVPYIIYVQDLLEPDPDFNAQDILEKEPSATGRMKFWSSDMVRRSQHLFDFVVTLGGDGTMLYTNWLFQCVVPPVLAFSLGSLGFLTRFDFSTYQNTITTALREGVIVSLWLRFECTIMRAKPDREAAAMKDRDLIEELVGVGSKLEQTHVSDKNFGILNDVVVDRGPNPSTHTWFCIYQISCRC